MYKDDVTFQTYFASVRASTADGSTVISSDGITILPVGSQLEGIHVWDAMPCYLGVLYLYDF